MPTLSFTGSVDVIFSRAQIIFLATIGLVLPGCGTASSSAVPLAQNVGSSVRACFARRELAGGVSRD